jgi:hypothetical protein
MSCPPFHSHLHRPLLSKISREAHQNRTAERWLSKCRRSAALKCMRLRFLNLFWTSIVIAGAYITSGRMR